MSINVFYRDSHLQGRMSGPKKVIENLLRSLDDCEVEYAINEEKYEHNLILQWDPPHIEWYNKLKNRETLLVGPQIWPFAPDFNDLKEYNKIIVPSQWCKESYDKFFTGHKILIWPVAIYPPEISGTPSVDCLIYHKNRSNEDLQYVKELLERRRLSHIQLQYGGYTQKNFRDALSAVKFCIIIDNTESQGIAIQEMMAANKPLFVWDQPIWDHMGEQYKIAATSVPYWDPMCGEKVVERDSVEFYLDVFLQARNCYNPAKYVSKELSPQKTVKIIMDQYV